MTEDPRAQWLRAELASLMQSLDQLVAVVGIGSIPARAWTDAHLAITRARLVLQVDEDLARNEAPPRA